ncbi:hypothetical protein NPS33_23905 [Pseudomonas putida]|uniref:hypothetical protein n=1 Tax=Pseudomonas putida TaxID=303 RepID=UPI00236354F6|nr:hypothetical protein [Pseudomonas putida]EKT4458779.1 hypothetical protein [Pseudomonas putida]EKT4496919.1 hypothetical protein [Pseudomonas putida]EKT4515646.1 hypothetical protein [Pseudomonas putida]EKT8867971.1 hypothetical protein [Pseudomonas putida]MDD2017907.1 hypothetical protein [Pseudomonas putida]
MGTEDWFGMVKIRFQRPSTLSWVTTLNDCEPPHTCMTGGGGCARLTAFKMQKGHLILKDDELAFFVLTQSWLIDSRTTTTLTYYILSKDFSPSFL